MTRQDALQIIADIGGIPGNNVNKTTNFLVVGQQDYRIVGDAGLSGKQQKALQLLENGADIEIISEDDFLKNINF
jgi:DNA polymerase-3 subunit epsilon